VVGRDDIFEGVDVVEVALEEDVWGLLFGVGFGFAGVVVVDSGFGGFGRVIWLCAKPTALLSAKMTINIIVRIAYYFLKGNCRLTIIYTPCHSCRTKFRHLFSYSCKYLQNSLPKT
jgi:hypothetical protein